MRSHELGVGSARLDRLGPEPGHDEGAYVVADAVALPFDGSHFDLVVAYNSLMDIEARALEDAGFLVERLREPTNTLEDPRHDRMPLFLHLRALKPA